MARMVKNTEKQINTADIIVKFADGNSTTKYLKVGDIVEGLRFIKNEEIISVTGRVCEITYSCEKVTKVDVKNPKDYFARDVIVKTISVDCSEQYQSKIVKIPAREIVEDEGVYDVVKVDVIAHALFTMDMEYTDGSIKNQELEVGDVITDAVIMTEPGKPDITGDFKLAAFYYTNNQTQPAINGAFIYGAYLVPIGGTTAILTKFDKYISFTEEAHADVTKTDSLIEITNALNESEDGIVYASLDVDVTIPPRPDGRITTTMIGAGKTLNLDLNNHTLNCEAYAFYVNGGTLNIVGDGVIEATKNDNAYPVINILSDGVCNMYGGTIDTTKVDTSGDHYNWLYGAVCSGNGIFNMYGGEMIIDNAAGIAITNGTASGEGARFTIAGDSKIISKTCAAVYLADNKSVDIKENAKLYGGIVVRMGDITVQDKAYVEGQKDGIAEPLGAQVCFSGVMAPKAAILALTGVYGSTLGNDMNIVVKDRAVVKGTIDDAIDIATINTKYDQKVNVEVVNEDNTSYTTEMWRVYNHNELAELAAAEGKTLGPETNSTDLKITVSGEIVYPVVDSVEGE